ncbi:MAG: hypothetical protein QM487_13055 [Candidatus Marithrix sp.]
MVKIIVEETDDKNLLMALLRDLNLGDKSKLPSYFEIMGGKSPLLDFEQRKYNKLNGQIELNKITKVLFIFDCDLEEDDKKCGGIEKSEQCFNRLKEKLNWNIDIDYYIFNRNLDYFLVDTITPETRQQCFTDFEECIDLKKIKPNRKPIANLYRDLYPQNPYDFSHKKFNTLKQKLINLFNE